MISGVGKIVVPVDDQSKAKQFWLDVMGFRLVADTAYGAGRWLEVSPGDGEVILVLSPRGDEPRRTVAAELPHSPIFFNCADIQKTYTELSARGVVFPSPPRQMGFGWWAMFEDCDGQRHALGQW